MAKTMKYSGFAVIICAVAASAVYADVQNARSKRTIGYLFRSLANTFASTTQKPPALPTAQPLKIISPPATGTSTTSTQSSVYKKTNYSPSMPAPDSEVIKPPIKPLVFPVISSPMPPFTAYYYQIVPSAAAGVALAGGATNSKSENYVSIPEKPARPTEREPIKAQLIVFPFSTATTGDENVNNDKNYKNDDDDDITITRLPMEKRKPVGKPPFNYRAEIYVHPRGTSGNQNPQDGGPDDYYRSYESRDNVSTDKKKWLEVDALLNPPQKQRKSKKNGDNDVEITKEKMVKICSVDEDKPLTYNKQEKPGGGNKDVEYVKPFRNRGNEERKEVDGEDEDEDDDDDDDDDDDNDDRGEEKSVADDEEGTRDYDRDGHRESERLQEAKRGKFRPNENDDGRFGFYGQNRPDPNFGRIVGDFYINFPHSISRGGYDFAVDHGRNNYGHVADAPFSMDSSFPVSHQKMDQFLPQTIYRNPFLAPRTSQQNTNTNFPYNGANGDQTNGQNPASNHSPVFSFLNSNLHDFSTPVPHTYGKHDAATDKSFNTYTDYNTDQNNQGLVGKNSSHKEGNRSEDESGDEDRKYSYSSVEDGDEEDTDERDDDDDSRHPSEREDDSHEEDDGGRKDETTTEQRHAEPPRLPASLHEEVQRNEGGQLQYFQHPPVFDLSADKSEQTTICFNMFGQRIICS